MSVYRLLILSIAIASRFVASRFRRTRRISPSSPAAPARRKFPGCTSSIWRRSAIRRKRRGRTSSCTRPKARRARRSRSPKAQARNPTKRGVHLWVETDGTIYWAVPETVIATHGDGANRNDNKYIDNSKTYRQVIKTNSIGVEFNGNAPDVRKPPTPEQFAAVPDPGAVSPGALWHPARAHLRAQLDRLQRRALLRGLRTGRARPRAGLSAERTGHAQANQFRPTGVALPPSAPGALTVSRASPLTSSHRCRWLQPNRDAGAAGCAAGRRGAARAPTRRPSSSASFTASCTRCRRAAVFPSAETRACYERLGKIAQFTPIPIRVEPAQCARFDMVRLDRIVDARPEVRRRDAVAAAPVRHGGGGGRMGSRRRRRRPPPSSARRSPPSPATISYECRPRNNIAGAQAVRARQGQCARCRRRSSCGTARRST